MAAAEFAPCDLIEDASSPPSSLVEANRKWLSFEVSILENGAV
jgi:hypothetical protein